MVMGKNFEYDGLDLIELLSEEFEVRAREFYSQFAALTPFSLNSLLTIASYAPYMAAAARR
jgi:hypothetical protein